MYLMLFKYLKGCNLVVSKFYFLLKCIWLKLQGLFAGSQKKKELCLREYKRKTGVKNITHYELFFLSNCIQLTSKSIVPFCFLRFISAILFGINVSLLSRCKNEIFPGIGERNKFLHTTLNLMWLAYTSHYESYCNRIWFYDNRLTK